MKEKQPFFCPLKIRWGDKIWTKKTTKNGFKLNSKNKNDSNKRLEQR